MTKSKTVTVSIPKELTDSAAAVCVRIERLRARDKGYGEAIYGEYEQLNEINAKIIDLVMEQAKKATP